MLTRRGVIFDVSGKKNELDELEKIMGKPEFWEDTRNAALIGKKASDLKEEIDIWSKMKEDASALQSLSNDAEGDDDIRGLSQEHDRLFRKYSERELYTLFSEKYDSLGAIVAIHSGTGGVDAMDFAEMLLRMYLRYAERKSFNATVLDKQDGKEAGIKSVTVEIEGRYAYGHLKGEAGVHRLVRISPFDAEKMRHTSFALVEVLPDLGDTEDIEINGEDLRIDTYRSSGAGGQHVNTTDSAVRIVHEPTGITVTCQSERSQHQNKERALKILKARLHILDQAKQHETKQELRGEYTQAKWGNQIRSYVLQPYQLVKDNRTKHETAKVDDVLDGSLDEFIEAYLKNSKSNKS